MAMQQSLGIGMQEIGGRRIAVLGGGLSGRSAAALALKLGAQVELWDSAPAEKLSGLPSGVTVRGSMPEAAPADLPAPEWCVVSPGIPLDSPLHRFAQGTGAALLGELEFAAAFCRIPLIGVTGTNGKTTTTELLTACLNAAGARAVAAGNIGLPLSQVVADGTKADHIILEISSFQLEHAASLRLAAGIVLNVTPDHLDRHGSFEAYRGLKAGLARLVVPGGCVVCPESLASVVAAPAGVARRLLWVSGAGQAPEGVKPVPGDWGVQPGGAAEYVAAGEGFGKWQVRYARPTLQLKGNHNLANLCAVAAVVRALRLPLEACHGCIGAFRVGAHRIQLVAQAGGVDFYDDSKATDVDAVVQALRTVGPGRGRRVLLIAGGLDKGCTLEEVKTELRMYVKSAFLIGQCRSRLAEAWRDSVPVSQCDSLEAAVQAATEAAQAGDAVLLSPGCASMDMFRDYIHRGEVFVRAVRAALAARGQK